MDITVVFRACVKTIKTRHRAFGENTADDKSRILTMASRQKLRPGSELSNKAKEVVRQVTRLRDFLAEHRKAYLNLSNNLSAVVQMTDVERDKIDSGAQRIINMCSNALDDLEADVLSQKKLPMQVLEHQRSMLRIINKYLKEVCKMYSEQRALRVQRSVHVKNMSRIESSSPKKVPHLKSSDYGTEANPYPEDEKLSPEELQMFEMENKQLLNELNSLSEEVRQIETKVVKLAELQEMFTERVLEQDKDIERISANVVGSTENMKDANEQIRQAIQRNAGLRVWLLFFLLVMSFSLLFLDWFND